MRRSHGAMCSATMAEATGNSYDSAHPHSLRVGDLEVGDQKLPVRKFVSPKFGRNLHRDVLHLRWPKSRDLRREAEQRRLIRLGRGSGQIDLELNVSDIGRRMIRYAKLYVELAGGLFIDSKSDQLDKLSKRIVLVGCEDVRE